MKTTLTWLAVCASLLMLNQAHAFALKSLPDTNHKSVNSETPYVGLLDARLPSRRAPNGTLSPKVKSPVANHLNATRLESQFCKGEKNKIPFTWEVLDTPLVLP